MEKILSICIPSYNMEKYLNRCVDTMLVEDILDKLELIIVNDGSKDNTLSIANSYKEKYPQSIIVIDKPNGHYGSCVNAALNVATGKYFRIVDADDWVNSKSLSAFVQILETIDVDVVFTRFSKYYEKNKKLVQQLDTKGIIWDEKLYLNKYKLIYAFMHMHCLTHKLELLKRINYVQTEGICYTDTEYVFMPLYSAQSIYCLNISLYQYFIGRNDQSTASVVVKKNFNHFLIILNRVVLYSNEECNISEEVLRDQYYKILLAAYLLPIHILVTYKDKEQNIKLRAIISKISEQGDYMKTIRKKNVFGIKYIDLWMSSTIMSNAVLSVLRLLWCIKNIIARKLDYLKYSND